MAVTMLRLSVCTNNVSSTHHTTSSGSNQPLPQITHHELAYIAKTWWQPYYWVGSKLDAFLAFQRWWLSWDNRLIRTYEPSTVRGGREKQEQHVRTTFNKGMNRSPGDSIYASMMAMDIQPHKQRDQLARYSNQHHKRRNQTYNNQ